MAQTRMTKQRAIILETLRSVCTHPTADEIYGMVRKKLPRISLGTVYRNLEILTSSGKILRLDKAGAQKHFDGNTMPHQHVRCRTCGCIGDTVGEVALPAANQTSAPGFTIHGVEVEFVGLCHNCDAAGKNVIQ